jgi:glucosamine-6-phosphate deaminase
MHISHALHSPRLLVTDPAAASHQAATLLAQELLTRSPVIGLATGSSVELVYQDLAALVAGDGELQAGVRRARAFALDEYLDLPEGDANTYRETLRRQFADPIGLADDRLHVPAGGSGEAPGSYDDAIASAGGIGVQLLGIGANGHIGFNEPGSPLDSDTWVVQLAHQTRVDNTRFFSGLEAVPTQAVTQGIGTIRRARKLVVLAFGAHKAAALRAALTGPLTQDLPASALRLHDDVVILADQQAAGLVAELAGTAPRQLP